MNIQYKSHQPKLRFTPIFQKNDAIKDSEEILVEEQKINKELIKIQSEQSSLIMREYQQRYQKIHKGYRRQNRKEAQEYQEKIKIQEERKASKEMKKVRKEKYKQMLSNLQLETDEGVIVEPMRIAMQSAMHSHHFYE